MNQFGIALYHPKTAINFGGVLRSAYNFGASYVCTIGHRYHRQASDTVDATKRIPTFHYPDVAHFLESKPADAMLVCLEVDSSKSLEVFNHPPHALYVFGPEDSSLPDQLLALGTHVSIKTQQCLNLSTCAGIVMYDRYLKQNWTPQFGKWSNAV